MGDKLFQRCNFPRLDDCGGLDCHGGRGIEDGFEGIFRSMENSSCFDREAESKEDRAAEQNIEEIERRAYAQGFSEGEKAGLESGMKKVAPVLKNFEQAKGELEKVKGEIYSSVEREAVELALAIAKKIVFHEVQTDKELIIRVVREALKKTSDAANVKIRVNPYDFEILRNHENMFLGEINGLEALHLIKDDRIKDGGCMIETDMGDIDARIETQLRAVEDEFRNELQLAGIGV
jgi:flagellar assembly protein FliH